MSTIKDLFLKLTKNTMPGGNEHLVEKYLPKGWKNDSHGNYYIKIGDPTTMFTSHVDTADSGQSKEVTHVIEGNIIKTDGKTILGADDKAGTAIMIYMIEKGITGLYYFFLNEERGCVGSRALNTYLDTHKDDPLYKKITKVIALDRRDDDSVITFQVGERCCSDEFADELSNRLNAAGGFKYKKDPTGLVTDSHQVAGKFSECTNLSVGYDHQHTNFEKQDIVFLQKLADACCKIDWETLPVKRDFTKVEHSYSQSYNRGRKFYSNSDSSGDWWEQNRSSSSTYRPVSAMGPNQLAPGTEFVNDYLGNRIKVVDAQWCEYDKAYCDKKEAIWVDYVGFYTTPDFDPTKVKKPETSDEFRLAVKSDLKPGVKIYLSTDKPFGTIVEIDENDVVKFETGKNSKFVIPYAKFLTYNYKIKSEKASNGGRKLTESDIKNGMTINHNLFGTGKIIGFRPDKKVIKVLFDKKGEKDLQIDVAVCTW